MEMLYDGPDHISLYGSSLVKNSQFIFISGNGYNIYNGMVRVYYNNMTQVNDAVYLQFHSMILSPERLNSNFGLIMSANERHLAVGGISYDKYSGFICIFEYKFQRWTYIQKHVSHTAWEGFGITILLTDRHLIATNYQNDLYLFDYDPRQKQFQYKMQTRLFDQLTLVNDRYNNLIVSDFNHSLYVYDTYYQYYYKIHKEDTFQCDYGAHMHLFEAILWVSCYNETINNMVYVYDIVYTFDKYIEKMVLRQTIVNPDPTDTHLGTHFAATDLHLAIVGTNQVHHYTKTTEWIYSKRYAIAESNENYDYKVQMNGNYMLVTNYGYNEWQGAVFSTHVNDPVDTSVSNQNEQLTRSFQLQSKLFYVLFLFILGSLGTVVITSLCYLLIHSIRPPMDKKKKKEEEEDYSPYKVYSYKGYQETDEYQPPPPLPYPIYQYYFNPYNNVAPKPISLDPLEKEKLEKAGVEFVPYTSKQTVVSYKEYNTYDAIQKKYKDKIRPVMDTLKHQAQAQTQKDTKDLR